MFVWSTLADLDSRPGVSSPRLCEGGGFTDPIFQRSRVRLLSDRRGQSRADGQSQSRGRTQLGDRRWTSGAARGPLRQSGGSTCRSDDGKGEVTWGLGGWEVRGCWAGGVERESHM